MTPTRTHLEVEQAAAAALDAVTAYSTDGDLELLADGERLDIRGELERRREALRRAELDNLELALAAPDLPAERRELLEGWTRGLRVALGRDAAACRILSSGSRRPGATGATSGGRASDGIRW